jgi:hypothetical protein
MFPPFWYESRRLEAPAPDAAVSAGTDAMAFGEHLHPKLSFQLDKDQVPQVFPTSWWIDVEIRRNL